MMLTNRYSLSSGWSIIYFFFFNDTATTEIYTLSLHDALPIFDDLSFSLPPAGIVGVIGPNGAGKTTLFRMITGRGRSEEHTSELQSRQYLVCRLLLEKKKNTISQINSRHNAQCSKLITIILYL